MAQCRDSACVAISSSSAQTQPNWWDIHQAAAAGGAGSLSPWTNPWQQQQPTNQNSNSSNNCEDHHDQDVSISSTSFTNASNHSSLSVDSSRRLVDQLSASSNDDLNINNGEHVSDNHIWSQVLLSVNGNNDLDNNDPDVGENFLAALSSKSLSSSHAMYEPACDYLKKLDNTSSPAWEFTNLGAASNFNNFEKQINGGFSDSMNMNINIDDNERLTKLSNLVSTWSIAPPQPQLVLNPQAFGNDSLCHGQMGVLPAGALHGTIRPTTSFNNNNGIEYQIGLNNAMAADQQNRNYFYGSGSILPDSYSSSTSSATARNFADVISFTSRLVNKPLSDHIHSPKPSFKSFNSSDHSKKQGLLTTSSATRGSSTGRGQGIANEGKKKRTDDTSTETVTKKPKQEASAVSSSVKMQVPKVKTGDRIAALQQIVSPFGKTDTASVLYEAIQYIKFLQDQVHVLLSSPYLKTTNSHKDPWAMDRKDHDKVDAKLDLQSKGLCLVPISSTPHVYRENTGSDYWTPTYRGCLYR